MDSSRMFSPGLRCPGLYYFEFKKENRFSFYGQRTNLGEEICAHGHLGSSCLLPCGAHQLQDGASEEAATTRPGCHP